MLVQHSLPQLNRFLLQEYLLAPLLQVLHLQLRKQHQRLAAHLLQLEEGVPSVLRALHF